MGRVAYADLRDHSGQLIGVSFSRNEREAEEDRRWARGTRGDELHLLQTDHDEQRDGVLTMTVPGLGDESAVLMMHANGHQGGLVVRETGEVGVDTRTLADIAMRTNGFRTAVENGRRTVLLLACAAGRVRGPGGVAHDLHQALRHKGVSDRVFAANTAVAPIGMAGVRLTEVSDGGNWNVFGDMLPGHEAAVVDELVQAMRSNWRYADLTDTRPDGRIGLSDRARTVALAKSLVDDAVWRLPANGGRLDLADVLASVVGAHGGPRGPRRAVAGP
jgi:hypothetical protein